MDILKEMEVEKWYDEVREGGWFWQYFFMKDGTKIKIKGCNRDKLPRECIDCHCNNGNGLEEQVENNQMTMEDIKIRIDSITEIIKEDLRKLLKNLGFENFYVNAGGDVQFFGKNAERKLWKTGIKNPFKQNEIVKVIYMKSGEGIATSGNYIRGDHIYNPKDRKKVINEIVSFTVIGPNVCEADRFATAVFAMGKPGINFLEDKKDFAGYMIDKDGIASMTSNFDKFTKE